VAGGTAYARLHFALRYSILDLLREVSVGSAELAALGLIGLSLIVQTVIFVSPGHFRPAPVPALSTFISLGTLAGLVLAFAAGLPLRRCLTLRVRQGLCVIALGAIGVLALIGTIDTINGTMYVAAGAGYSNDGAVMDQQAAIQALAGHNPYHGANIATGLAADNLPSQTTTPLMVGPFGASQAYPLPAAIDRVFTNDLRLRPGVIPPEFESKYNYPAGSFLFILPFIWAGFSDMRFLYATAVILMGAYLLWRAPRALRPLAPLLVLANIPLVVMTTGGQPDPIYGLFLMIGFAEWRSRWASPLALAVAISTKQLAWFFVPFYLLLVARELGWREAARRGAIMGTVFGTVNLPFILQSPSDYITSISAPMTDPMFPLGVGLIALFTASLLPMLPKAAFTLLEIGAWALSTGAVARFRRVLPAAALLALGALPLFFAWRSLTNYFYLVPILVVAVLFAEKRQAPAGIASPT